MRVLLTSQLGEGHWRPLAALALALRAAGHVVAFSSTPACCASISRHGFACLPAGIDDDGQVPTEVSGLSRRAIDHATDVWRHVFAGIRVAQMLPDMLASAREWKPDLIVREISEFSGALAAEKLDIPHAALQISAWRPHLHVLIAPALDAHRSALRLPPGEIDGMLYRHLLLSPIPPAYRYPDRPYPPATYPISLPGYDLQPGTGPIEWTGKGRPRIYATLGTAYNRYPGMFRTIIDAVEDRDFDLVLTTGADPSPLDLGAVPSNVRVLSYLPQSRAFPHCDLVISHGGFGTVQAALRHGLPQILLPIAADQPDNAALCNFHGVGLVLDRSTIDAAELRRAIETVLTDPGYRRRTRKWQKAIEVLPGAAKTVEVLESLATSR